MGSLILFLFIFWFPFSSKRASSIPSRLRGILLTFSKGRAIFIDGVVSQMLECIMLIGRRWSRVVFGGQSYKTILVKEYAERVTACY